MSGIATLLYCQKTWRSDTFENVVLSTSQVFTLNISYYFCQRCQRSWLIQCSYYLSIICWCIITMHDWYMWCGAKHNMSSKCLLTHGSFVNFLNDITVNGILVYWKPTQVLLKNFHQQKCMNTCNSWFKRPVTSRWIMIRYCPHIFSLLPSIVLKFLQCYKV